MNDIEPDGELDRLAHEVIGAAIEVHRHLGPGYLESVYEEALAIELGLRGISFQRQVPKVLRVSSRIANQLQLSSS
jgi:GxxExxY protein